MKFRIGVDIGGTFTDCVVVDESGHRTISKALTTHGALADGVLASIDANAGQRGLALDELLSATDALVHGNTVATNAILTRTGTRTGVITTKGHEDALIIGKVYAKRAGLPEREIVHLTRLKKPDPIVPRALIKGVSERIDAHGDVIASLDEEGVERAARELLASGVQALAVTFLWSFINPIHERRTKEILADIAPGIYTSFSHELSPLLGEYERSVTTMLNSYVGPTVSGYLDVLQARLRQKGLRNPVLIMQASGGLTTIEDAKRRPIFTLDSGPTGGILGCAYLADLYGEENIVCTDVGGTSFDVGLILNRQIPLDPEPVVGQYVMRIPKLAVQSIGAGGGSIGWLDEGGLLRVGPQSAGSKPGPACYGRGGLLPTVTDADLVLGYLDPNSPFGGGMRLDRELALQALQRLGSFMGLDAEEVAIGMFRIINAHMADLIRKCTIERGHDPRDCVLFAYGGAGPTHAVFYGRDTGVKKLQIPADSTVFSAEGMLTCDLIHTAEASRRHLSPFRPADLDQMESQFAALEKLVLDQYRDEGADAAEVRLTRSLGMRYRLQVHTIEIETGEDELTPQAHHAVLDRFAKRYARIYGEGALMADGRVESELQRVTGRLPIEKFEFRAEALTSPNASGALSGDRQVYFEPAGYITTPIYSGEQLRPGNVVAGPAVVQRMGDAIVVPPGFIAEMDRYRTISLKARETEHLARRAPTESVSA